MVATPKPDRSEVIGGRLIEVYRTRGGLDAKVFIDSDPTNPPLAEWFFDKAYGLSVVEAVAHADALTPQPAGHEHTVDRVELTLILIRRELVAGNMAAARAVLLDHGADYATVGFAIARAADATAAGS